MKFSKTHTKSSIVMMGEKREHFRICYPKKEKLNSVNEAMDIYMLLHIQHPLPSLSH